jgi:hypothetical protein
MHTKKSEEILAKSMVLKNPTDGLNNLMAEIGLVYVKGSLPRFEEFGNLLTFHGGWDGTWKASIRGNRSHHTSTLLNDRVKGHNCQIIKG